MGILDYRSPGNQRSRRVSHLVWIGLATLVFGTGPLLLTIALAKMGVTSDPNPNPVGLGFLAFLTFWPGVILTIVGAVITVSRLVRRSG